MYPRLLFALLFVPLMALEADPVASGSGPDLSAIDQTANPCADFYQYACGKWVAQHPLPSDRSRYGRFTEVSERNEKVLLQILEAAAPVKPGRSAAEQKVGDAFASCMDTATINQKGIAPLMPELERIGAISDHAGIFDETVRLHSLGVSVFLYAHFGPAQQAVTKAAHAAGLDLHLRGLPFLLNKWIIAQGTIPLLVAV